MMVKETRHFSY